MHGTDVAAVITGSSTAALTESNAAQSTGGDLNATDVDSLATFMEQSNVAGSNGYGNVTVDAAGSVTYPIDIADDEFAGVSTTPTPSRWRRPTARRTSSLSPTTSLHEPLPISVRAPRR